MQDCSISIANALEILQSCTKAIDINFPYTFSGVILEFWATLKKKKHGKKCSFLFDTSVECIICFYQYSSSIKIEFPAQRASNAENVSIWWRRHAQLFTEISLRPRVLSRRFFLMKNTHWNHDISIEVCRNLTLGTNKLETGLEFHTENSVATQPYLTRNRHMEDKCLFGDKTNCTRSCN